ncbi:hypothetical protein EIP91_003523 [Steccherinum ochraceum]|uniref:Uncharacterized protein n=1 Tax=Steccherinum ochraceum TaxID=92696 RepID=A0A4R0RT89_9APHY|nr:hypothetical protein EIP91_003523 [Steccherinum ochraceum]
MQLLIGPGFPHVVRYITQLSPPVILVVFASYFFRIPLWYAIPLTFVSLPVYLAFNVVYKRWQEKRRAAALGAVLPPSYDGVKFGNTDVIAMLLENFKHGYPGDGWTDIHEQLGGTVGLRLLWDNNYLTNDAHVIKAVLATDFNSFGKGQLFQGLTFSVLGTGVFNADGDMWKFHRHMTRPFFSKDRISHFDLFEKRADIAINKMRARFSEGEPVDFQDLIWRFTLDAASEFLFGECIDHLALRLPYPRNSPQAVTNKDDESLTDRFARGFARAQETIAIRGRTGFMWPFLEIFTSKTADDMKDVDEFLNPIVQRAVENYRKEDATKEVKDEDNLLSHLVRSTTDAAVLHDELLNILLAGRDTTAGTLTFAIYFLCTHPHVLERLRKEILETVGPSRRPDYDDIRDMKYMRAFLNETMRLYPSVPFNSRFAFKDTTIPNPDPDGKPLFVPAGTSILYSVMLMHRRKDYWGEDAEDFDPDRFFDDRVKHLLANPFIFLPFNAGPRICLGQQFAYNEMSFFLIRLLQNFSKMDLRLDAQTPPPKEWAQSPGRKGAEKFVPKLHLTSYSKDGMWVTMQEAEPTEL